MQRSPSSSSSLESGNQSHHDPARTSCTTSPYLRHWIKTERVFTCYELLPSPLLSPCTMTPVTLTELFLSALQHLNASHSRIVYSRHAGLRAIFRLRGWRTRKWSVSSCTRPTLLKSSDTTREHRNGDITSNKEYV